MLRNYEKIFSLIPLVILAASPLRAQDVATTSEDEWISLSGQVEAVLATGFVLDYGENDITVELDQFDWRVERSVLDGAQVTVTGRMDRNFYDNRSIEAAVVYVSSLNEYLYADPTDEEGDPARSGNFTPGFFTGADDGEWLSFSGRVTEIKGDELSVDTGVSRLRVDTSVVPGALVAPSVSVGDRVLVTGEMDAADFFDKREVEANSVTKLTDVSY